MGMLPIPDSGGAPYISGGSSTPGTPTPYIDPFTSGQAAIAAAIAGTPRGTTSNSYIDPFTNGQAALSAIQTPGQKLPGPASISDLAAIVQAKTISDNTKYAMANGIVANDAQLSDKNFIANHPVSTAVKTAAPAPTKTSGGGSGLASPSSLAQLMAMAGGGTPDTATTNKQATDLVTAQFQPLLDELNRQLAQDQTVYGQQSAQVKADQARLDSNTQAIYSLLHNQLGELQGQSDQQYGETGQQVGGSFDQLMSRLNDIYGGAGNQLQGDLSQLGLQGAADNFGNHSLIDNYKLLTGLAGTDKAATMGNLATEGQGFHTLLGDQARQATATGNDQQSAIDTLAEKELIQLKNNLENQLTAINTQKANINTEKGQQIAAEREKLQTAIAQTNNQLSIAQAKLQQGAERIDLSRQGLAQKINQNTFSDQLALQKLAKQGGSAAQNKTKLGNAETTLSGLLPNSAESGAALNWLAGGKTKSGADLLTLINSKGIGAVPSSDLTAEANVLQQRYGGDLATTLQALKYALMGLAGYGYAG